jgi:hypothetical protein
LMCLLWLENRECRGPDPAHPQKALGVKLPDRWSRADAVFDDENLVSCAGLVPVMGLAEQTGLSELIGQRVRWKTCRVASAGANPARKLSAIIAGMAAGADSIDDLDLSRCGAGGQLGEALEERLDTTGGQQQALEALQRAGEVARRLAHGGGPSSR